MLMIGKTLTPEQRLRKAVIDIMAHKDHIAIAPVLMVGSRTIETGIGTACTDGVNEMYDPEFIDKLNDAELRFLVLHETYHKVFKHITTWKNLYDINPQAANMACDYVINLALHDVDSNKKFITAPKGALMDEKYRGMNSKQIFDKLMEDAKGQPQGGKAGSGGGGAGGNNGSLDKHDWEAAQEMSAEEQKQFQRELDSALRQGALAAGKMGSGADRALGDLLTPQVDWREALREFISTSCTGNDYSTWRRPNRRYLSSGYYMPSGVSMSVGELVVAIDTSGSIGGRVLSAFLSEVKAICDTVKPETVRVLYWDTEVAGVEKYDQTELDNLVTSTKPRGGGGTDVSCVPAYLAKHNIRPQAAIVLTDGYLSGSFGDWQCPSVWCVIDNRGFTSPVGVTLHINE